MSLRAARDEDWDWEAVLALALAAPPVALSPPPPQSRKPPRKRKAAEATAEAAEAAEAAGAASQPPPPPPPPPRAPRAFAPDATSLLDPPGFVCPEPGCGRRFVREMNLTVHVQVHAAAAAPPPLRKRPGPKPPGPKPAKPPAAPRASRRPACVDQYYCPVAGCEYAQGSAASKSFPLLWKLRRHFSARHSDVPAGACAYCGRPAESRDALKSHEKWCHVTAYCLCGAGFRSRALLTGVKGHLRRTDLDADKPHGVDLPRIAAERAQRLPGSFDHALRKGGGKSMKGAALFGRKGDGKAAGGGAAAEAAAAGAVEAGEEEEEAEAEEAEAAEAAVPGGFVLPPLPAGGAEAAGTMHFPLPPEPESD